MGARNPGRHWSDKNDTSLDGRNLTIYLGFLWVASVIEVSSNEPKKCKRKHVLFRPPAEHGTMGTPDGPILSCMGGVASGSTLWHLDIASVYGMGDHCFVAILAIYKCLCRKSCYVEHRSHVDLSHLQQVISPRPAVAHRPLYHALYSEQQ